MFKAIKKATAFGGREGKKAFFFLFFSFYAINFPHLRATSWFISGLSNESHETKRENGEENQECQQISFVKSMNLKVNFIINILPEERNSPSLAYKSRSVGWLVEPIYHGILSRFLAISFLSVDLWNDARFRSVSISSTDKKDSEKASKK